jgi:hypothetical protein
VEKIRERDEKILRVMEFLSTAEAEGPLAQSLIRAAEDYNTIFADFYCTSEKTARALEVIGFKRHSPDEKGISFPSRFQPFQPGHFEVSGAFWLSAPRYVTLVFVIFQTHFFQN